MPFTFPSPIFTAFLIAQIVQAAPWYHTDPEPQVPVLDYYVSLGPRPFYIIDNMTDSPLKTKLQSCENGPFKITDFSIGHRGGATLQIPEESVENAMAGARFGAGILECDTALTSDKGLVCRHSLCDLHTTTKYSPQRDSCRKMYGPIYASECDFSCKCFLLYDGYHDG